MVSIVLQFFIHFLCTFFYPTLKALTPNYTANCAFCVTRSNIGVQCMCNVGLLSFEEADIFGYFGD